MWDLFAAILVGCSVLTRLEQACSMKKGMHMGDELRDRDMACGKTGAGRRQAGLVWQGLGREWVLCLLPVSC